LFFGKDGYLHFVFAVFGRIFNPAYASGNGGRGTHEKIGNKFAVVSKPNGYDGIKYTKNNDQKVAHNVAFGNEKKSANPYQRCNERQYIKISAE
jgi:hypothetical protein